MADSILKFKLSHLLIRLIALANLFHFLVGTYSRTYYEATRFDSDVDIIVLFWLFASSFILILWVGLEVLWLRTANVLLPGERKSIAIDGLFALIWFFT